MSNIFSILDMSLTKFSFSSLCSPQSVYPSIDDDWDLKNGHVPGLFEFGETRDRLDGQIRRSRVEGFVRSHSGISFNLG